MEGRRAGVVEVVGGDEEIRICRVAAQGSHGLVAVHLPRAHQNFDLYGNAGNTFSSLALVTEITRKGCLYNCTRAEFVYFFSILRYSLYMGCISKLRRNIQISLWYDCRDILCE